MFIFSYVCGCFGCMYDFCSVCMQYPQKPEGGIRSSGAGGRVVSLYVDAGILTLVFFKDQCPQLPSQLSDP